MNKQLRKNIVEMIYKAREGHIPSSFSIVDIIDYLYGNELKFNREISTWEDRDYFILSKGHGCAALWVVLEKYGLISAEDIENYSRFGGILGGHPDREKVSFVEASTGSLGHGLPMAVGLALANKIKDKHSRVFCLMGDGECHEGTVWESAHVAANRGLNNLVGIVDWNQSAAQLCPKDDLPQKWRSFGWNVVTFDGHDEQEIKRAFNEINSYTNEQPSAAIALNTKGKGVSFIEGHGPWHHKIPSEDELAKILEELS